MENYILCEKPDVRNRKRKLPCGEKALPQNKQMCRLHLEDCITSFETKIKEGPYFICPACN